MAQEIFTKAQVNVKQLADEIFTGIGKRVIKYNAADIIDGSIEFVSSGTSNLVITFALALSVGEQTTLGGIVSAHTPNQYYISPYDPGAPSEDDSYAFSIIFGGM